MSLEAALEEERIEVEALIAARTRPRPPSALGIGRSPSPYTARSPVRSMLDIGPSRSSMLNVTSTPVRSMLDMDSSSGYANKQVFSTPSSPVLSHNKLAHASNASHPRHMSDAAARPVGFGPRAEASRDLTSEYQFSDIITANTGHAMPKRVSMGNKKSDKKGAQSSSSMAHLVRGNDISKISLPGDRGRNSNVGSALRLGSKSMSPHNRLAIRSSSPAPHLLSGRHLSPSVKPVVEETYGLDMNNAYRQLSDANLLRAGGSLAEIGRRKKSDDQSGGGRLTKDYLSPDGEELLADSSDDGYSSQEEGERGRKAARSFEGQKAGSDKKGGSSDARKALSLLAAAEEERIEVAKKNPHTTYQYRSLLDEPEITLTGPGSERHKQSRQSGVHPATSFDDGPPSGTRTPVDSDTEADLTDIRRAQKLSFSQTAIKDTPNAARALRIIYRGDWRQVVQEAKEEQRPLRKYIVATDLSDESTHALEWAVGTVLRDGDTMLCISCVDEEIGNAPGGGVQVPDDSKAMKEQGAALNVIANSKVPVTPGGSVLEVQKTGQGLDLSPGPIKSKAEEDRHKAVKDITERVTRLLRKTRLQVRVIVEVLHCKNPKHQILEIIDVVNPTLVVVGSRGQSALKGVILGSFSNYLVTKSSVPVMVARKKLRKQSKYKKMQMTQVNNITNPMERTLSNAKVDP
ncbi:hypothetical protein VP1G_00900 [Cytospora mali]|uniref:UspA domain-containing protein n=1 Tax=Cytospora mali TaxID=578113 RepID=A0A194UP35_CYTMA|nr:hypothetical protein VP1G_00900 [Valsa mali var. pyri (nom. inval.)]